MSAGLPADPQADGLQAIIWRVRADLDAAPAAKAEADELVGSVSPIDLIPFREARALAQATGDLSLEASKVLYGIEQRWGGDADTAERIVYLQAVKVLVDR